MRSNRPTYEDNTDRVHDAAGLQQLIAEYGQLDRLDGHTPQSRGRRFNEVIAATLRCWGIEAEVAVRSAGEIDVAFAVGSQRYILEAKWEQPKADTGHVAKLQRRVAQRFQGTVGLFLAMAGYSPDALDEVDRGGRLVSRNALQFMPARLVLAGREDA